MDKRTMGKGCKGKVSGVWEPLPVGETTIGMVSRKLHAKNVQQGKRKKSSYNRKGKKVKQANNQRVCTEKWSTYKEYLRTEWWQWRRKKALNKARWTCVRCKKREDLQVHHKHYRTLGREGKNDLEVLCKGCHNGIHHAILEQNAHLDSILGK